MSQRDAQLRRGFALRRRSDGVAAVYTDKNQVGRACVVICGPAGRDKGGDRDATSIDDRMTIEVENADRAQCLPAVDVGATFRIAGVDWAVESVPQSPPAMWVVQLTRTARTTHAGRRR